MGKEDARQWLRLPTVGPNRCCDSFGRYRRSTARALRRSEAESLRAQLASRLSCLDIAPDVVSLLRPAGRLPVSSACSTDICLSGALARTRALADASWACWVDVLSSPSGHTPLP